MNIDELYLLVENDEKIYKNKKTPDFINNLINDYENYKENGGDTICHVKFHPYDGKIYWIDLLFTHEIKYSLHIWRQIKSFIGDNTNIFSYMFQLIEKYEIICDCVNEFGISHFIDKLDEILKKEIPGYINTKKYRNFAAHKHCEERGINYEEVVKNFKNNRKL